MSYPAHLDPDTGHPDGWLPTWKGKRVRRVASAGNPLTEAPSFTALDELDEGQCWRAHLDVQLHGDAYVDPSTSKLVPPAEVVVRPPPI